LLGPILGPARSGPSSARERDVADRSRRSARGHSLFRSRSVQGGGPGPPADSLLPS